MAPISRFTGLSLLECNLGQSIACHSVIYNIQGISNPDPGLWTVRCHAVLLIASGHFAETFCRNFSSGSDAALMLSSVCSGAFSWMKVLFRYYHKHIPKPMLTNKPSMPCHHWAIISQVNTWCWQYLNLFYQCLVYLNSLQALKHYCNIHSMSHEYAHITALIVNYGIFTHLCGRYLSLPLK